MAGETIVWPIKTKANNERSAGHKPRSKGRNGAVLVEREPFNGRETLQCKWALEGGEGGQ